MSILMSVQRAIASLVGVTLVAGCAGSPLGNTVQESLEADPQLEEGDPFAPEQSESTPTPSERPVNGEADSMPAATDTPSSSERSTERSTTQQAGDRTPAPTPENSGLIGPVLPEDRSGGAAGDDLPTGSESRDQAMALTGVPEDLHEYLRDLQGLKVLTLTPATADPSGDRPTAGASPWVQPISRREYARWLFASYNRIAAEAAGDRLRPGNATDQPAFKDVPMADPDFAAIQGLAAAGIIPSAWTGNSTDVNFRPDAPLSREDLILWKVPLDTRAALPKTTPESVTEAWGFQDTASIDPLALRAIAADYQLGDFANIRRAFGYTTLFRPDQTVTRAEAAAVLWRFGTQTDGRTAAE